MPLLSLEAFLFSLRRPAKPTPVVRAAWIALLIWDCLLFPMPALTHTDPGPDDHADPVQSRLLPPSVIAPASPTRITLPTGSAAQRPRYYLAMDDHTDYMWSGDDVEYRAAFGRMLDYYMTQAESTANRPWDLRGRFTVDGTFWLSEYKATHSAAEYQRLISHVRDSSITVPLNTSVQTWGSMPAEAALRSMYPAGQLERTEGLRFSLVLPQEDQTLPGGVASLWAGAGAKYAWKGVCQCATCINAGDRPRDVYRFVGPDGTGVIMKWTPLYAGDSKSLGGYAEARDPAGVLDLMQINPQYLANHPYDVHGAFGYGWDDFETETSAVLDFVEGASTPSARVISSNEVDFFRDMEASYGGSLPQFGNAFGNEWELLSASLAEPTAQVKRSIERLRTSEALATVVSLNDTSFMNGRDADRDSMTLGCGLYWEHSWSGGPGVSNEQRIDWQRQIQRAITRYVDKLQSDALLALGAQVAQPAGAAERHVVFNPLSWARNDVADLISNVPEPRRVVDLASQAEVPSQSVVVEGQARLRIIASGVPSLGYRTYEVRPGASAGFPQVLSVSGNTLANGIYSVTLGSRGQLTSLRDLRDGSRQWVPNGQALNDLMSGNGSVVVEANGAASATLRVVSGGTPSHEVRLTLHRGLDRIDVEGRITSNFGGDEGQTWNFALPGGVWRHEEVGMLARAGRATNGGDYADANARTDYLTANHFVDLSSSLRGVTMSVQDGQFFKIGNSTTTFLDENSTSVRTMVGFLPECVGGFTDQGGDAQFLNRYSLRIHGVYDAAAAMRFALEHQNPLVSTRVTGQVDSPLPAAGWSLLGVSDPNVLVWAVKPAEEGIGAGVIVRAWNLRDVATTAMIAPSGFPIGSATATTHIETDLGPAPVFAGALAASFSAHQMRTFRLRADGLGVPVGPGARVSALFLRPNPASAATARIVSFSLAGAADVDLSLHDLRGARVATLAHRRFEAGLHDVQWSGQGLNPGVYFLRLTAAGDVRNARVVVIN
ncbi:MAG: T9SS type A sorting domain-containing protein [Candidatus Eisenbacteria bacterium]